MSSSIAIPKRKGKMISVASSSSESSLGSRGGSEYGSYGRVRAESMAASPSGKSGLRRPSLMSASFSKAEHTVVNVGDSESPRLITCVKASQGFHWNQEIFLPSYANYDFDNLENKRDPVQEIVVTDEEVANMFPS
ncbi:hypothetical protein K458DRAFT_414874 [Lentithecium fluviatile CBS 122367]|uniref:Uncharacterized protein n=1 Tax=Lentithecium fluviatile CBS 122367 TaxID=1168545 RepID=A0A6G1JB64_9PLEO|nr:hypothetical protein K458DRAFT_414874 [Lentithecium fluviatile CBS 122367]